MCFFVAFSLGIWGIKGTILKSLSALRALVVVVVVSCIVSRQTTRCFPMEWLDPPSDQRIGHSLFTGSSLSFLNHSCLVPHQQLNWEVLKSLLWKTNEKVLVMYSAIRQRVDMCAIAVRVVCHCCRLTVQRSHPQRNVCGVGWCNRWYVVVVWASDGSCCWLKQHRVTPQLVAASLVLVVGTGGGIVGGIVSDGVARRHLKISVQLCTKRWQSQSIRNVGIQRDCCNWW